MRFKQWLEAISPDGYGIYEEEAFENRDALNALRSSIQEIGSDKVDRPEATGEIDDPKAWHIKYIRFNSAEIGRLESIIKAGMFSGWYSLLWTPNEIRVIFKDGTHIMTNTSGEAIPSFDPAHLKDINTLARRHGLDFDYMSDYLKKGISGFTKQLQRRSF